MAEIIKLVVWHRSFDGRIQLLTGPRQVGKTTLLLEIAGQFGDAAIYVAGDEPDAALPGFWERRWAHAEARAQRGTAVLLLDEIHHLSDWAKRLKGYWDCQHRRRAPIHVVATGSSALRVTTGSRESLAGRFERMGANGEAARFERDRKRDAGASCHHYFTQRESDVWRASVDFLGSGPL